VRALSGGLGRPLPFDALRELRRRMWEAHPALAETDVVRRAAWGAFGEAGPVDSGPFTYSIGNFYRTDPISRASETMARCSELFVARRFEAPPRTISGPVMLGRP
jgi:NADH-quinone oxidoreductase subunit G